MPTTGNVPVNPAVGTTDAISTFQVTRDAQTENVQAIAIVDATTANPALVDTSGSLQALLYDLDTSLRSLLQQLADPLYAEAATGRLRVTLDAISTVTLPTVSTVNTVSTVTTISNIASVDPKQTLLFSNELIAWGVTVRQCITG